MRKADLVATHAAGAVIERRQDGAIRSTNYHAGRGGAVLPVGIDGMEEKAVLT